MTQGLQAEPRAPDSDAEDLAAFRETIRQFVTSEIEPHINAWEEAGEFPRALYPRAGELGLLGLGFPERYGGTPAGSHWMIAICEELARAGSGGLIAGLLSHGIGAPPIAGMGDEALKDEVLPAILAGEKISALAITEPGGGSDVANLRTSARRDGDHYVVNGSKTFITSGVRADYITTAVRTGDAGMGGVSLLLIPGDAPGLTRTALRKMGWWCSDTATLYFDDCRVPARNLLGEENEGFRGIMMNFNNERLMLAAMAYAFSRVCLDEAVAYARARETFGRPLIKRQVIRHKLVDMAGQLALVRSHLYALARRVDDGEWPIAEVCMLKNSATQCLELCAKEAVQIFGGAGYMRDTKVERIYRETKVLAIGGGAEEIMKDLAARQLGW
ncbi:MAG: acyl-CoA dehydrogenase family protein [Myxococcales bacterium]|nr:acyl-CoA dehydrogenase family protein [Myxococcales bacterium]MCB9753920.1 acyl-CoA dehydrogenase family protein [Myxococcales bacterium]